MKKTLFTKRAKWEMAYASYGSNQFHLLLADGWEPFAVYPSGDTFSSLPIFVIFKRQIR